MARLFLTGTTDRFACPLCEHKWNSDKHCSIPTLAQRCLNCGILFVWRIDRWVACDVCPCAQECPIKPSDRPNKE